MTLSLTVHCLANKIEIKLLLFPSYILLAHPVNFPKMPLSNSNFKILTEFFLCYRVKKNEFFTNLDFIIQKLKKNRARYLFFRII